MPNPLQFLREAKNELFRGVWPARQDVLRITIVVIIISVIVALFLGGIDFGLNKLVRYIVDRQ